ncbi:MAG: ribosomal protein S18-alanine N-acetyltransferase [Candidatus Krumholzibacteria bacterium]|nr:ribosomal protein S18-alanine N-acetyltransferase [Candidatus Krumholzibacteria bacterium]
MADPEVAITVRTPLPEDMARVVAVENRCFVDPWSWDALEQELASDRLRLPLVAEVDGKVVGYLMAWKIVDQLHVLNIAADPGCRRRGVGTALLLAAAGQAVEMGLVEVTLEVRESNSEARAFYLRHGFIASGLRRSYYADNGEDAIIMTSRAAQLLSP